MDILDGGLGERRMTTDHLNRDEKDFAIEHAGYLADTVERVLRAENSILDAEEWLDLNTRVYEFRKRAARVASPPQPIVEKTNLQIHPVSLGLLCLFAFFGACAVLGALARLADIPLFTNPS
jgi:hypothetical protein